MCVCLRVLSAYVAHKQIKMAFRPGYLNALFPLLMMELVACRFGSAVVLATRRRRATTTAPPNKTPYTASPASWGLSSSSPDS